MENYNESQRRVSLENAPILKNVDIERARELAENLEYKFNNTTIGQAESMASFAGVEISGDEVRLYCALRERLTSPEIEEFEDRKKRLELGEKRAWELSDQEILAVVFSDRGGAERLQKFISTYPNIFKK